MEMQKAIQETELLGFTREVVKLGSGINKRVAMLALLELKAHAIAEKSMGIPTPSIIQEVVEVEKEKQKIMLELLDRSAKLSNLHAQFKASYPDDNDKGGENEL